LPGDDSDADFAALFDAVGFERPALVVEGVSGGRAIHFVAAHPELVSALVLVNSFAHYVREHDYPWGVPRDILDRYMDDIKERWGTVATVEVLAPSRMADERFRAWYARSSRYGLGPDQMADFIRANWEDDVRPLLPSISVPTLVLHRRGDRMIHLGAGRYLAEHIPDAKFVVLPGDDHMLLGGRHRRLGR
jgi:pimeloyl-ACP methyl ester carboxylesterase